MHRNRLTRLCVAPAVFALFHLVACVEVVAVPTIPIVAPIDGGDPILTETDPATQGSITISGVRLTKGNAVNCPEILADDGKVYPVKGLSPDIALGQRVTITGVWGVATSCNGRIIVIERQQKT